MRNDARLALKLASGLLEYPGHPAFWPRLLERAVLADTIERRLGAVFRAMEKEGPTALEALYVGTFDFDPKASLYMTAHELPDSRDRGRALIELGELYRNAGYEVPADELPDYLPVLVEFIAIRPAAVPPPILDRVARVAGQLFDHLGPTHVYGPLFPVIRDSLGSSVEVPRVLEERPDLVDLPYPIDYQ